MAHIDAYRFKHIEIDGNTYNRDVIIHPAGVIDNWWRQSSHELLPEDLEEYLSDFPPVLIVGTGKFGRMNVPDKTRTWLSGKGVKLEILKTGDACTAYNQSDETETGAALHLTC